MNNDKQLLNLTNMDNSTLEEILEDEIQEALEEEKEEELRTISYLEDLNKVLSSSCGLKVLRKWLDQAYLSQRLGSDKDKILQRAALYDFARDRMAEIALANPVAYVRLQLVTSKEFLN